jgi:hypothetical protein
MALRYQKTDAGRAEIRARTFELPRSTRTLLLIIDGTKAGEEWLRLVNGVGPADLERLLALGLVASIAAPVAAAAPAAAPAVRMPNVDETLAQLGYRELYDRLTAEARVRLGLVKGYRMVLEIEKCSGAEEIRGLAMRFIEEVRAAQGDKAAREFVRGLAAAAAGGIDSTGG